MVNGMVISFVYIFGIIAVATVLNKKNIISGEGSRKFIHIAVSNWWFIAIYYFKSSFSAAIIPAIFVIINYISYKNNIFSAMERASEENSPGTIYYAISLFILSIITFAKNSDPWIGAAGILTMGYGDGFAAILGQKYGRHKYKFLNMNKSIEGSLAMLVFSFLPLLVILIVIHRLNAIGYAILISVVAMLLEALSPKGTDNLTVPLVVSFLFYALVF